MILYKFEWAPSETIFKIGSFGLHYYSLMFVIAFAVGYYMMRKFYRHEKVSEEYLEPLFVFTIVGTLLGARLGEVFFYNWDKNSCKCYCNAQTIQNPKQRLIGIFSLIQIERSDYPNGSTMTC